MRRKEREVTEIAEKLNIIEKCDVCRLALSHENTPYIVPMNFGYTYENDMLTLYFHGAKEGKKWDIINENPHACFEMDCSHKLVTGENACNYSMEYESVIGNGIITVCTEKDEKISALQYIMKTYAKDTNFTFPDDAINAVCVFKLTVTNFTAKCHMKGNQNV